MEVVIETPKGSREKFKFDERTRQFIVNKTLPDGMRFPFNFGFVPETKGEDGDPLDVIILSTAPYPTGTRANVRIIGCLPAHQTFKGNTIRNDRFLYVPMDDPAFATIADIRQLSKNALDDMQSFFVTYAAAAGKRVEFEEPMRSAEAVIFLQIAKSAIGF